MSIGVMAQTVTEKYALFNGDSAEILAGLPSESVDLICSSPPFSSLFTYSASERDLGNCRNDTEYFSHLDFIIRDLLRVLKPGRVAAIHVMDIPAMLVRDGYIGLKDFSGDIIRAFIAAGWVFDSRIPIDKNQQAQCLRDGTPVLTPFGWNPIESLRDGDYITGSNGLPTRVTGVLRQGVRQLYRVTFSDGASVDCDASHRWMVRTLGNRQQRHPYVVMTTEALLSHGLFTPTGRRRFEIPIVPPVEYGVISPLPIDPYLLGAILGDGNVSQRSVVALTTQPEIVGECVLPDGHEWWLCNGSEKGSGDSAIATYNVRSSTWHQNDVLNASRSLGLQGKHAWDKFIPDVYKWASVEARRSLLQGILDTDGAIKRNASIKLHTTSDQLADDVTFLAQSLGAVVRRRLETVRHYQYKGEQRNGRPLHELTIGLTGGWCPFRLPSKAARWKSGRRQPRREIVSIEPVDSASCTCITVEAIDGLYVTQHCIVTHNSIRTHAKHLTMSQFEKDRSWMGPALPDYILKFRKPGENAVPVHGDMTRDEWIEWANPTWPSEDRCGGVGAAATWYGISESDTLNVAAARTAEAERHVCPLQLETIERCVRLWSNKGETVLDPFDGIGSVVVRAVQLQRRGLGLELNPRYHECAVRNVERAIAESEQKTLFDSLVTA